MLLKHRTSKNTAVKRRIKILFLTNNSNHIHPDWWWWQTPHSAVNHLASSKQVYPHPRHPTKVLVPNKCPISSILSQICLFLPFINLSALVTLCPALPLSPPIFCYHRLLHHLATHSITDCHSIRSAIRQCLAWLGQTFTTWLATICLVIEVSKEDDEGEGITNQTPVHPFREGAVSVERKSSVTNGDMELDLRKWKTVVKWLTFLKNLNQNITQKVHNCTWTNLQFQWCLNGLDHYKPSTATLT